jgi:hypothetical protein
MRKNLFASFLILLCLVLSGWGSKGHRKVSQNFAACLPAEMSFLQPVWTTFVGNHASDADYRKSQDPNESPRHYIDIDNYPVFIQTGRIPHAYDSLAALYDSAYVLEQGILPWATLAAFDSLKSCFQRGDWNKSAIFAADLGHYIADGHMPLHITVNYDGKLTGQSGIHSRYETSMVSRYETQIVYPAVPAEYVSNVSQYVFNYLYYDYQYVDSLLLADTYAKNLAGNTTSDAYYQALWAKTGSFTILLMSNASKALADLIYTAWMQAGSPMMHPNAISEPEVTGQPLLLQVYPNPVTDVAWFPVVIRDLKGDFSLEIYDLNGNLKDTLVRQTTSDEVQRISWETGKVNSGTYICVLKSGSYRATTRFVVSH